MITDKKEVKRQLEELLRNFRSDCMVTMAVALSKPLLSQDPALVAKAILQVTASEVRMRSVPGTELALAIRKLISEMEG